jgi:predicted O-linked N-acetylglucosamine transferase (SPINDLY family)
VEQQAVRQQLSLAEQAFRSGDAQLAERLLGQVISLDPGSSKANELLAYIAGNRGHTDLAFELLKKAVASSDASAEAFYYLGTVYLERKLYGEAIAALDQALEIGGDFFEGLHDLGAALAGSGEYERALRAFEKAHSKNGRSYELYCNVAKTFHQLKRHGAAMRYYDQALAIDPGRAEAWAGRAAACGDLKRYDEALASYGKALCIKADSDYAYGNWLHMKMMLCDWSGLEEAFKSLEQKIMDGHKVSPPFPVLATPASLAAQRKCAEIFVQDQFPACTGAEFARGPAEPERLKIGYFSADFRNHATTYLMADLLERHDRSKFEVVGFSFGPPAEDEMRKRVASAFDRFFDVRTQTDRQIAELSRSLGVHVAVDLKGFTQDSRPGIFALRAAPVQAGYLGYPGTMAARFIDYLIADAHLIPPDKTVHYSEKIAYLPDSYQVNGSGRKISDRIFTRAELGLPQTGFVFACFNNNYKITPDVFDIWMRLLSRVPDSVLWLFEGNKTAGLNLGNEARKRGIPAERLIFAGRMDPAEHLARYRAADLFLDTFHYNAHTTASDALWAGLPVLTYPSETFAGRVAASLLIAIGLPELISQSPTQYEALGLELAMHPEKLGGLKAKLVQNKLSCPLFDTARFTRNIEGIYFRMWQRHLAGFPPEHIYAVGDGRKQ